MEVNMKEWILRYAEQQNEEEKNENSKSLEEEEAIWSTVAGRG